MIDTSDRATLEALYRGMGATALEKTVAMTGERDTAITIVQDVFLRLWRDGGALPDETAVYAWVYKACHTAAIEHLRNAGRLTRTLSPRDAEIVGYAAFDHMTTQEIAALLELAPKVIERVLAEARAEPGKGASRYSQHSAFPDPPPEELEPLPADAPVRRFPPLILAGIVVAIFLPVLGANVIRRLAAPVPANPRGESFVETVRDDSRIRFRVTMPNGGTASLRIVDDRGGVLMEDDGLNLAPGVAATFAQGFGSKRPIVGEVAVVKLCATNGDACEVRRIPLQ